MLTNFTLLRMLGLRLASLVHTLQTLLEIVSILGQKMTTSTCIYNHHQKYKEKFNWLERDLDGDFGSNEFNCKKWYSGLTS